MPLPSSQGGSDPARPLPPSEPGPAVRQRPAPASTTPETGAVLYLQRRVLGRLTKPFSFYPNHGTGYSAPESDRPGRPMTPTNALFLAAIAVLAVLLAAALVAWRRAAHQAIAEPAGVAVNAEFEAR